MWGFDFACFWDLSNLKLISSLIDIIKSTSGPCHDDTEDSVSFIWFSMVDYPISSQSP